MQAYRKLALKWHPDRNRDKVEEATEKFKEASTWGGVGGGVGRGGVALLTSASWAYTSCRQSA